MKPIKLIYWRTTTDNYGDLLSPYLIGKLSGCVIVQKNYFVGNWKSHLYYTIKSLVHLDWGFRCRYLFPFDNNVIGIGSILYTGNCCSQIWGCGFMSNSEKCIGGTIYALRGKYSLAMVKEQIKHGDPIKLSDNIVLGDPALLLPLIIKASEKKCHKVGIIPHFSEVDYFIENFGDRFHIIDLRSSDIEGVTRDIISCHYILSTSLHGIIVAHAYGIPALWMEHTGLETYTKGFKFLDYFSAVGIDEYTPIRNFKEVLVDEQSAVSLFAKNQSHSLLGVELHNLQQQLLKVAPFKIKKSYINE